jgi:hypothetical protein
MLTFLATVLEQLDLALEHLSKGDVYNSRFALMLTDNAVELVLHQIAKDKQEDLKFYRWKGEDYAHQKELDKAVLRHFSDKVRFARLCDHISLVEANTLDVMHEFRNELYHAGLSHEEILPTLSKFYFDVACRIIGRYNPRYVSWGSGTVLPDRARKYFGRTKGFPGTTDEFAAACNLLAGNCGHNDAIMVTVLADNLDRVIDQQNVCIDIVAEGVYEGQKRTRDRAVVECQAWSLAFSDEGKAFAISHNWTGNNLALVDYLAENYPFRFGGDPIQSWERQAKSLRAKRDGHAALIHYNSFIIETSDLRDAIEQSARAAEAEIDLAIERARGN